MAIHNRTSLLRVAQVHGSRLSLTYRYETWVRLRSRTPMPRVDLRPLAERLTALEPAGVVWATDPVDALTPRLAPVGDGHSHLDPARSVDEVRRHLATATSIWSPYDQ
jgi:hypothetical protein